MIVSKAIVFTPKKKINQALTVVGAFLCFALYGMEIITSPNVVFVEYWKQF